MKNYAQLNNVGFPGYVQNASIKRALHSCTLSNYKEYMVQVKGTTCEQGNRKS